MPREAPGPTPTPFSSGSYLPLHGISVDFLLEHFLPLYHRDGREAEQFVYGLTQAHNCSFAELLLMHREYANAVSAKADFFVSFCYQSDFYEVLSALEEYRKNVARSDITVWLSIFSFNLALEKAAEPLSSCTDWFQSNLPRIITEIGSTLFVMSTCLKRGYHLDQSRKTRKEVTYFKPKPLERFWCLAELALTLQHSCELKFCLSRSDKDGFVKLLFRSGDPLKQLLRKLDIQRRNVNGAYEEGKRRMMAYFRQKFSSEEDINSTVRAAVRAWYMDQVESTVENVREYYSTEDNLQAFTVMLNNVGMLFESRGNSGKAEKYFRESMAARLRVYGDSHANYAGSLTNLAGVLHDQGKISEAQKLCEEALKIYKQSYGENHELVASGLNDLARVLQDQGKYEEAKTMLQQALSIVKSLFGEESEQVADALNNLGYLLLLQKNFIDAREIFEKALELDGKFHGEEHPNVSIRLNNIAATYQGQGECAQAKGEAEKALKVARVAVGQQHPLYAQSLLNLAEAQVGLEEYSRASLNFREAADVFKQSYGKENEKVSRALNGLAASLRLEGKEAEAVKVEQELE